MTTAQAAAGGAIRNRDMLALKQYVEHDDAARYAHLNQAELVLLDLTHSNLQQVHVEIRFSKRHDTVADLRNRIHLKTGTPPQYQDLTIFDGAIQVAHLPADTQDWDGQNARPLGYFGVHHGMRVHCLDTNPQSGSANGAYEDVSLVPKYQMSDDAYNARTGTLREWTRQQRAANPNFSLQQHAARHRAKVEAQRLHKQRLPLPPGWYVDQTGELEYDSDYDDAKTKEEKKQSDGGATGNSEATTQSNRAEEESIEGLEVGMRCQVTPGERRGKIGYVGAIPGLPNTGTGQENHWVGVILDEPVGQNDGSVQGVVYMPDTPGPRYGVFVRPSRVQAGDFPEQCDWMDDDDSEEEL